MPEIYELIVSFYSADGVEQKNKVVFDINGLESILKDDNPLQKISFGIKEKSTNGTYFVNLGKFLPKYKFWDDEYFSISISSKGRIEISYPDNSLVTLESEFLRHPKTYSKHSTLTHSNQSCTYVLGVKSGKNPKIKVELILKQP